MSGETMQDGTAQHGTARRRGAGRAAGRFVGRAGLAAWRLVLVVCFVVGGAALGGFFSFVHQVQSMDARPAADAPVGDGVVVLTGGPKRIAAGLDLLEAERGDRMLITGVNPRTSSDAIQNAAAEPRSAESARLFSCCVDLGREAADTVGNADEAREWIRIRDFDHVIVVTADFHMPRALLEFARTLEADGDGPVKLTPWPVDTPLIEGDWYRDPAAIRRLGGEWVKYLSAQSKGWFGAELLKEWFPNAS